ncbi:MAG: dihydroorotate dehydrogenase [Anaerolineae bacterium]|nr:dihydroorotate dehydrogenase [Anaerolineae bacterium]
MRDVGLSVELCGVRLRTPFVLAAGVLGTTAALLERVARRGAGAVTAKSCSVRPRRGHPNPTVLPWEGGLINAVGLANPGAAAMVAILADTRRRLAPLGVPLIASVFAEEAGGFGEVVRILEEAEPDFYEVNISCPNVAEELGLPFAADPVQAARATAAVRAATRRPVIVKLSPNVADICAVGRAVVDAGADALAAINTLGPGMLIDIRARTPVLANRVGGLSGPAVRPVAVRCVYDLSRAVAVPIIGMGGVTTGEDAVEMIMAGATAVGVGSAFYQRGMGVLEAMAAEIRAFMQEQGFGCVSEMRGLAHGA